MFYFTHYIREHKSLTVMSILKDFRLVDLTIFVQGEA